jgi:hypothetical protein
MSDTQPEANKPPADAPMTNAPQTLTGTTMGLDDGAQFTTYLCQPAIKEALARYVHAEARFTLWAGFNSFKTEESDAEPEWLDKATEGVSEESDAATFALEAAIHAEVTRRVEIALAAAQSETQKRSRRVTQSFTRRLSGSVQRNADTLLGIFHQESQRALKGADGQSGPGEASRSSTT